MGCPRDMGLKPLQPEGRGTLRQARLKPPRPSAVCPLECLAQLTCGQRPCLNPRRRGVGGQPLCHGESVWLDRELPTPWEVGASEVPRHAFWRGIPGGGEGSLAGKRRWGRPGGWEATSALVKGEEAWLQEAVPE